MASAGRGNPILNGTIDYGRVFVTFTENTDEKISHGLIFEAVLSALKEGGIVLQDGQPTSLVDLGCGEGHTACEMIDAINRVHPRGRGVDYYGFDADTRFVRSTQRLLTEVKGAKHLRVIRVQQGNVLSGKRLPLAAMDHALATMGHVLYYTHSDKGRDQTRQRIADVVDAVAALLGYNSLCLFAHSAQDCLIATLRASVANSVEAKPAGIVTEVARAKRLVVVSFVVPYHLHFPRLTAEQWEQMKEPSIYGSEGNSKDVDFITALELLAFIAQRDLSGLAREGNLGRFVDDVKGQLGVDGALRGLSGYQLMLSRKQSPDLQESVEAAVRSVEQSLDGIVTEAERVFEQRKEHRSGGKMDQERIV